MLCTTPGERSPSKLPSFLRTSRVNMLRHYKVEERASAAGSAHVQAAVGVDGLAGDVGALG